MEPANRRSEGLQRIWLRREPRQRLDARAGQHQLGAQHCALSGRLGAEHLGGGALFDALEAAQRRAQRFASPLGNLHHIDQAPLGVSGESDSDCAGTAVYPACDPAL